MEWKTIKMSAGAKLFQVYNFTYIHAGNTYSLEVDEYLDGNFSGHGEHTIDKSSVVESVSGKSLKSCLEALIAKIQARY